MINHRTDSSHLPSVLKLRPKNPIFTPLIQVSATLIIVITAEDKQKYNNKEQNLAVTAKETTVVTQNPHLPVPFFICIL